MATLYVDDGYWEATPADYAQTGLAVDWELKIVHIPKIFMTLIQSVPTIIYELDLNLFRLEIADIQDDSIGMPFDTIVSHTPPVAIGGVTLARVVELINGYTVTFEDDQYAANLVGANTNLGDLVNVNQVSVRTSNSAGLVDNTPVATAVEIAAAVWDEPVDDHQILGSFGRFVKSKLLTVGKFLGLK